MSASTNFGDRCREGDRLYKTKYLPSNKLNLQQLYLLLGEGGTSDDL